MKEEITVKSFTTSFNITAFVKWFETAGIPIVKIYWPDIGRDPNNHNRNCQWVTQTIRRHSDANRILYVNGRDDYVYFINKDFVKKM